MQLGPIIISADVGSDNLIELQPGGVVVLGPGYDRDALAETVGNGILHHTRSPPRSDIGRNGFRVFTLTEHGTVEFATSEFTRNTEAVAFLGRLAEIRVRGLVQPAGPTPVKAPNDPSVN